MLKLLEKIPKGKIAVAVSGGADSMAVLDFILHPQKRSAATPEGSRPVILFFNHGTPFSHESEALVSSFCQKHDLEMQVGTLARARQKEESLEEFWRMERLKFLKQFQGPVIMGHNLDDAVETYCFNMLHGKQHTIAYAHDNLVRPFLLTTKKELLAWCQSHHVPFLDDPANQDLKFMRSRIRQELVPLALKVNPGLYKVVAKKIMAAHTLHKVQSFVQPRM